MPRRQQVQWLTPAQRIERRAIQAARAIVAGRSILSNRERIIRHLLAINPLDHPGWLAIAFNDAMPGERLVIAQCAADALRFRNEAAVEALLAASDVALVMPEPESLLMICSDPNVDASTTSRR